MVKGAIQISKIAAAQRLLDAAIRMYFQKEDALAIHAITAQALQVLRDLTKKRGGHFTKEIFASGVLNFAQQYVAGTLPPHKKAMFERNSSLMQIAELIHVHGTNLAKERIRVHVSKEKEHKLWLSETTVFLKHAERDPDAFLAVDMLDNEKMLVLTCAAYVDLMKRRTPEIVAYLAFWCVRNHLAYDLAEEVQQFARQLGATDETQRYEICNNFIRDNKTNALR